MRNSVSVSGSMGWISYSAESSCTTTPSSRRDSTRTHSQSLSITWWSCSSFGVDHTYVDILLRTRAQKAAGERTCPHWDRMQQHGTRSCRVTNLVRGRWAGPGKPCASKPHQNRPQTNKRGRKARERTQNGNEDANGRTDVNHAEQTLKRPPSSLNHLKRHQRPAPSRQLECHQSSREPRPPQAPRSTPNKDPRTKRATGAPQTPLPRAPVPSSSPAPPLRASQLPSRLRLWDKTSHK